MSLDPTRAERITASMAPALMSGNAEKLQNLFLRAIGDPRYEPDDFENSWAAAFGLHNEPFVLDWHAKKIGEPLIDRGTQYFHPTRKWVSATLDARRASDNCVIDVKCVNAWIDIDTVIAYYAPQMVIQQECAKSDKAALLIMKGNSEPQEWEMFIEDEYRAVMWQTIERFWECVETLTEPFPLHFPRVVPPEQWRRIDLDRDTDQPNWAEEMRDLLNAFGGTEEVAKTHETIKTKIKRIFPDDCGRLAYANFAITRAKNNAVTIRNTTRKEKEPCEGM